MHLARSRWRALAASRAALSLTACLLLSSAEPARGAREGAAEPHLIQDAAFRAKVEAQFAKQRRLARNRGHELFDVLRRKLTLEEREALKSLFAFMPLSDLADYDGEYYLRVVRTTLEARRTMPWGPRVPEDVFLHYVLPQRVNTEDLDEARSVIFGQIKDRVKGLPLADAVLEVNHWCHERVTYRASDMRTSAPLATLRTSWGRCGEESTLVVIALRAVGIPARQVYTPRWAHVDDNHAWVEAWVDGKWRYLGACEPEAALDMAWFREPARRAMMVHTKVMGGSPGSPGPEDPEDRVQSTPWFDEINVLSTYAPTLTRVVRVVDGAGHPVANATVEFGLYNSAEFYPLATKETGADGTATLASGKGDLRIWARKGPLVGYRKLSAQDNEGVIVLGLFDARERVELLDLVPPEEPLPEPVSVGREALERNQRRLAEEDRLREAYMATFMSQAGSGDLAKELGLDTESLWSLIRKSQGNWPEMAGFLRQVPAKRRPWAMALLGTLTEKDLRDTPAGILRDHLDHGLADAEWGADHLDHGLAVSESGLRDGTLRDGPREGPVIAGVAERELEDIGPQGTARRSADSGGAPAREAASGLFVSGVLAPRIANELLRPWRSYLQNAFGPAFLKEVREDPEKAVSWVRRKIRLDEEANYNRVPLSPRGVYDLRVADTLSRDIFFVALCRAAGVPARLEPATSRPQFHAAGIWKTVTWDGKSPAAAPVGRLSLSTKPEPSSPNPAKPMPAGPDTEHADRQPEPAGPDTEHADRKPEPAGSDPARLVPVNPKPEEAAPAEPKSTLDYYVHFTLARFQDGRYETLDLEGKPWSFFQQPFEVAAGDYVLTTGNRQRDGSVLARQHFFALRPGETRSLALEIRSPQEESSVLGRLEMGRGLRALEGGQVLDLAKLAGAKGVVLSWIGQGDEPTDHALRDLERLREPFEHWGGGLVLVLTGLPPSGTAGTKMREEVARLPRQTIVALDDEGTLLSKALESLGRPVSGRRPVFLAVTPKGEVVYVSEGYNVGVAEQVLEAIHRREP